MLIQALRFTIYEPNPHTVINLNMLQVCTSHFSFLRKGAVLGSYVPSCLANLEARLPDQRWLRETILQDTTVWSGWPLASPLAHTQAS